jgi:hypothetical protein
MKRSQELIELIDVLQGQEYVKLHFLTRSRPASSLELFQSQRISDCKSK